MSRESAAVRAVELALGMGLGGLLMFSKDQRFKDRHGCYNCKYQSLARVTSRCMACSPRKGSEWEAVLKKPKKVFCGCCGQEKRL